MNSLRSERLSKRLYWAMSIIILSLLLICIPLIKSSSQNYINSLKAYDQLEALRDVADLANKISRERGPANKVMSGSLSQLELHKQELEEHRNKVDAQLKHASEELKKFGFIALSLQIENELKPILLEGRKEVDAYANLASKEKSALKLDHAILSMFSVWQECRDILKGVVVAYQPSSSKIDNFASQILLLSDLRDQAGRVVSNVTAHVTFGTAIPEENLTRTLQTVYQVRYLWDVIDTIQPKEDRTPEFIKLHADIEKQFLNQGIPVVLSLLHDSAQQRNYHMSGLKLTEIMGEKFATVVDLQSYMLQYMHDQAQSEMSANLQQLLWTIAISLISIATAISTMVFARRRIFLPLIKAREILFDLSKSKDHDLPSFNEVIQKENDTLFAAIKNLEQMLQQRDALEFRLKNIAHSDSLTGLSNRFALEEYTKFLEAHPSKFSHTCLMIIDIDHFKAVNDQHGHIIGDQVIQSVADCLKWNVRTSDMIVRYGGDEFLILIENIEMMNALNIANKIRKEVNAETILDLDGDLIPFSVSIGVAIGADSWLELFDLADQALFKAKAKGRNVVAEA